MVINNNMLTGLNDVSYYPCTGIPIKIIQYTESCRLVKPN